MDWVDKDIVKKDEDFKEAEN